MRKLLQFAKEIEGSDPETVIQACLAAGVGVLVDHGYDPLHGKNDEERHEWALFHLFLASQGIDAAHHIEWLLQRFKNAAQWLGGEGEKFRALYGMRTISDEFKKRWETYYAAEASLSESDAADQIRANNQAIEEARSTAPIRRRRRRLRKAA